MKELLMGLMKSAFRWGFDEATRHRGTALTGEEAWQKHIKHNADALIRYHAKTLGIDTRDIPTEPGLYWAEIKAGEGIICDAAQVQVYRTHSQGVDIVRMRVIYPPANNSWQCCTLDDPRVVRYLGRVNPEPIPMGG
jgi:hypothetical protein